MINKIQYLIVLALLLFISKYSYSVDFPLHVSHGKSSEMISLRWQQVINDSSYAIYRSDFKKGPFKRIATVNDAQYNDYTCEAGIEYYYKIKPEATGIFSEIKSGYRQIDLSKRYNLDRLLEGKNQETGFESETDKGYHEILSPYYTGWLRIQFILFVSKPYIMNKTIFILTDFDKFTANEELSTITFHPYDQNYSLEFYSQQPFSLLNASDDEILFERLIKNSIAFCVYKGDIKIRDRFGRSKYIPNYEAIGLATQYNKYAKSWPDRTILFSSNKKDLIKEVKSLSTQQ